MTRPDLLTFEVLWYAGGPDHAPNRVIGRTRVRRRTLDAAITYACRQLARPRTDDTRLAHGFYVRLADTTPGEARPRQARVREMAS